MVNNHAGGGGGTTETLKFGDKIILKFDTSDKGGIGFLTSTNGRNDNNKARPEQLSATIVDNTQIFGDTVESSIFAVVPPQQYKNQKLLFKNYGNRLQHRFWEQSHYKQHLVSEHGFTEEEKKQIKALTAAVVGELQSNEKEVARLAGQSIHYGQIIQLMHSKSNKCLSLSFVSSPADPSSLTAVLNNHQPSKACYFRILSEFKMRSEGEKVRIGDRILLQSVKSGGYLSIAADGGGSGGGGSRAHVETELDKTPLRHQQWLESIISNSSQTSWQVHCFQDFKTSMEDLRSDNLFRFYNKEMESYLAASYGAKSIGLMSHEFDIAKPRQLNDAAIYWQIKPIGELNGKQIKWGESCRIFNSVNGKYLCVNSDKSVSLVLHPETTTATTTNSDGTLFSLHPAEQISGTGGDDKCSTARNIGSCPFRLFNTSTSTWLHLVAQNNRKVAIEDAILNKVGKTEQDSRIRFQSKLDISDLSNVLLMYKVNEDTMRKLAYVSSFRDPLKCILESSNVMEGLVAKKTLSISSETQHRIFTIVRDIVFFCTESQDTNFATRVGIPIASHQEMIRQSGLLDLLLEFLSFEAQLELAEFKNTRMVFQYIYRLLMIFLKGDNQGNEIYVYKHMHLIQNHLSIKETNAADTMRELLSGSKFVIEKIKPEEVEAIIKMVQKSKDYNLIETLVNMCVFQGYTNVRLQNLIVDKLFKSNIIHQIILPTRINDLNSGIEIQAQQSLGRYVALSAFFSPTAESKIVAESQLLFNSILRLYISVCFDRNKNSINTIVKDLKLMTREECEIGIQDASLPPKTRSLYCGIMATLFVDSITKDESPAKMIYVFDEVLSSQGRAFSKSTATKGQVEPTTNLEVSTAYLSTENVNKAHPEFEKTKDWIRHFLDANRSQTENNELNELVSCTLELLFAMVRLGFYDSNSQLEQLLPVLLDVLDGRNDGLSGGDKTDVLDAEETDRFIKNEMTEVLITTKVQICNIIDKIMDNRLRLRMSKIVSCWKTEHLSNPQGLPLGTHANTGLLNLLITGTDYKDFKNLDEILLDLVNYDDNELRRISFKILQRNYSDFEETGEFLNSALILKSNQSISLYRQIISLITRLGVIPRVFFTEGDIKAVIGILDELAAKCRQNVMEASDNISLSSLTAQMILGNFDVHELLIERLKEIRDSQSVSSDTKSKLYASSAKFLHRLVQGNDAMKLPLMENLDSLILLLEEPKCADLFEEMLSLPKVCLRIEIKQIRQIVHFLSKQQNFKPYITLLKKLTRVKESPVKRNQSAIIDSLSHFGMLTIVDSLFKGALPLDKTENAVDILELLADCTRGESKYVESIVQNLISVKSISHFISNSTTSLRLKRILLNILSDAWVCIGDKITKNRFEISTEADGILVGLSKAVDSLSDNASEEAISFVWNGLVPYLAAVCEHHGDQKMAERFIIIEPIIIKLTQFLTTESNRKLLGKELRVMDLITIVTMGIKMGKFNLNERQQLESYQRELKSLSASENIDVELLFQEEDDRSANESFKRYAQHSVAQNLNDLVLSERNDLILIIWLKSKEVGISSDVCPIKKLIQYLSESNSDMRSFDTVEKRKTGTFSFKILYKLIKRNIESEDDAGIQNMLDDLGATDLALAYSSEPENYKLIWGFKLLKYLMLGGNKNIQDRMYRYFKSTKEETIFYVLSDRLKFHTESLSETKSLLLHRQATSSNAKNSEADVVIDFDKSKLKEIKLILRVVQMFCEGHNRNLQEYLRVQEDNIKSFNIVQSIADFFSLVTNVSSTVNLGPYFEVHLQTMDTIIELVQGSPNNRLQFYHSNIIEGLMKLLTSKIDAGSLKTSTGNEKWKLKIKAVSILTQIFAYEGPEVDDQYKREVAQLLNWHLLQKTMNESFSLRNAKGDTGENLQPGFDIYHLFKVLEAFISENDMAVFKAEDHTIESSTRVLKSAIKLFAEETAMKFFGQGTGVIEILNEQGQLQKLYYRKASNSKFLTKQIRDDIVEEVDRSSPAQKIKDFIERSDEALYLLDYSKILELKLPWFDFILQQLRKNYQPLWMLAYIICIALNIFNGVCMEIPGAPITNDFDNGTYHNPYNSSAARWINSTRLNDHSPSCSWYPKTSYVLGSIYLALWSLIFFEYTFGKYPGIYFRKKDSKGLTSVLSAFSNKDDGTWNKILQGFKFYMIYVITFDTIYHAAIWIAALIGVLYYPIAFFVMLLDIMYRSSLLKIVITAFGSKALELMSVAWMAVISIFSFVVVTALAIGPLFQPDECQYLLGCLGLFASVTLESGYGGALALTTKLTPSQVSWLYVLSIAYYLIISSVILNAVTGLIIDSFGAQREARESNEEEMNNNCFICSLNRSEFQSSVTEFEEHISNDHYMWDYLGFLAYLRQVESTSYNEIESFIAGKIEQNDISWVPINKAMRLEAGETAKMSKRVEKENSMHDRLSQIEQSLKILVEGAKQEKQNLFK